MIQHTALTASPWDVSGELNVTMLTPTVTPRISDPIKGLSSFGTISHNSDGVVAALTALLVLVNTTSVELEVGLNTNSDDMFGSSSDHLLVVVLGNVGE